MTIASPRQDRRQPLAEDRARCSAERSVSAVSIKTKAAFKRAVGAVQVEFDGPVPAGVQHKKRGRRLRGRVIIEPTGDEHDEVGTLTRSQ